MRTTTLAALVTACALPLTALSALPAHAATSGQSESVEAWSKAFCRTDGTTRVRIRVETTGTPLVDYSWRVAGRDPHVGDVLVEGGGVSTLVAFTIPAGGKAKVSVGDGGTYLQKTIPARTC